MALYLLCLTTTGLPIFTRKKGDCDNLPFSTVASLNGFHMFFKSLGVSLKTTYTNEGTYIWRDFHNAVTLIAYGRAITEKELHLLTELIFGSFSLFISRDEIVHPALLERMKKESKNYMPIVEAALDAATSKLLGYTDCVLTSENSLLLQRLNEFSSQCRSLFCCISTENHVVVATEGWWDLNPIDRSLLMILLDSFNTLQNDVPVYLPEKSPNVAYRFVTVPVAVNSVVCVICGLKPSYREIHTLVQNGFRNETSVLQIVERCIPRNLPESLEIDPSILAVILVNTYIRKCVFARNPHQSYNSKRNANCPQRLNILRKFFNKTIEDFKVLEDKGCLHTEVLDQYWCSDYYKCYSQFDEWGNVILLLFLSSVPPHTMKYITQALLHSMLRSKSICW